MIGLVVEEKTNWVPAEVERYLRHTVQGESIRKIAREQGCHPSTIMRQVRRWEGLRDDPLIESALARLTEAVAAPQTPPNTSNCSEGEVLRCLQDLSNVRAMLVVSGELDKAVIIRGDLSAEEKRAIDRQIAEVLALKEYVCCAGQGLVSKYKITREGRMYLAKALARAEERARARLETTTQSATAAHINDAGKVLPMPAASRRPRYGAQETTLQMLARLPDKNGEPFLSQDLVRAGERLREDYELAQIGHHLALDQSMFLESCRFGRGHTCEDPSERAHERATRALNFLGPGLSDVAIRCCCHLERLESVERQLGWSARSGKIVLRIALQQLVLHYNTIPACSEMIG